MPTIYMPHPTIMQQSTGSSSPRPAIPDPRLMLCLIFVTGTCIWQLPQKFCLLLGFFTLVFFSLLYKRLTLPPRAIKRLALFVFFWMCLKLLLHYVPLAWVAWQENRLIYASLWDALADGMVSFLGNTALWYETAVFCVQLTSLVMMGIMLAGLYSAYTLACGFNWWLRPLRRSDSWRTALALALLLHYIPRIFETLDTVRMAARLRGLPDTGRAYWKMVFPRFFSILAQQTWLQAIAVSSRNLDSPHPWQIKTAFPRYQMAALLLYIAVLAYAAFFMG